MFQLVQKPGEIIVTFPRGYHFGENLVENCCEAVAVATKKGVKFASVADFCTCQPADRAIVMDIHDAVAKYAPQLTKARFKVQRGLPYTDPRDPMRDRRCPIKQFSSILDKEKYINEQKISKKKKIKKGKSKKILMTEEARADILPTLLWLLQNIKKPLSKPAVFQKVKEELKVFPGVKASIVQGYFKNIINDIVTDKEHYSLKDSEIAIFKEKKFGRQH